MSEEGLWRGYCCHGRSLTFFLAPHIAALPGEVDHEWRAGGRVARMEQAAAPPASIPRALWQQWQDVGIRCSYLATERAFPPGINGGARPRLAEH